MPSEDSDFSDPVRSAAKGVTDAVIDKFSKDIDKLIKKFLDGELGFIEDRETIDSVKSQRNTPEFKFYSRFVTDSALRLQMEMGLSLRNFEKNKKHEALQDLRNKITMKYGTKGLHVAQLVQVGILARYTSLLLGKTVTEKDLQQRFEGLLKDVDKYVIFVETSHKPERQCAIIQSRLDANLPPAMILFSRGNANSVAKNTVKKLVLNEHYTIETQEEETQLFHFIIKKSD